MKKLLGILLILTLILPCVAAFAEEVPADIALRMYEELETLLLSTNNVTLEGEAVLSLNGYRFKTVKAKYVEADENSLWDLHLSTPRIWDPDDKESGFTVIRNDDFVYSMEVMKPGIYSMSTTFTPHTLLTETVQLRQLLNMGRLAVGALAGTAGEDLTVEKTAGGDTVLHLTMKDGEGAGLLDVALNLGVQSALWRFRRLDPGLMNTSNYGADVTDYTTVFEGLMYCLNSLSLGDTDFSVTMDADGRLVAAGGKVNVNYVSRSGSKHLLTVEGSVRISDYGTSTVAQFDPAEYGVAQSNSTGILPFDPDFDTCELSARALEYGREAGFKVGEQYESYTYREVIFDQIYTFVTMMDENSNELYYVTYDPDFALVSLSSTDGNYLNSDNNSTEIQSDPEKAAELIAKAKEYAEKVCPGILEGTADPQFSFEWKNGDEAYVQLDWLDTSVMMIVKVAPEFRIEHFSTRSNG